MRLFEVDSQAAASIETPHHTGKEILDAGFTLATWFKHGSGMAIGVLVGALTLGKASPYLINSLGGESWRQKMLLTSALAVVGGLLVLLFVGNGPYQLPNARFDIKQITRIFHN